ncbi:MAG: hypothetical protein KC484_11470 [Colwelliaceae bacterium]|nr:hypothetical protein [Colwelliaceae bacterium]
MKTSNFQLIKTALLLVILAISTTSYATTVANKSATLSPNGNSATSNVYTFQLSLWSPEQLAPAEAKPVEIGGNYFYLYNPEAIEVDEAQTNRIIKFEFHPSLGDRYQFRWLTADHPQYVTLNKMKPHRMKVLLNDGEIADDIYFEVWVLDTLTGEVFMCDPQVTNKGKL